MININYFSNNRPEFFRLIFDFILKIKDENKSKITLNILTSPTNYPFFKRVEEDATNIKINVIAFNDGFNYTDKLKYVLNLGAKYSIKLDEDCLINNHIWDYMIENCEVLDNEENLLISPTLSTTIPSCDEFINGFLNQDERNILHRIFLNQAMPNGLFGVNYEPLNKFTTEADTWDYKAYLNGLSELQTETKGMHPMRISYDGQISINHFILKNTEKLSLKNDYSLYEIKSPYFTNNLFMIKTSVWKHIFESYGGVYDEIPISNYMNQTNKKLLFIKNGYGVHTMYNTIHGNSNKWGIGGVDSAEREIKFMNELTNAIL